MIAVASKFLRQIVPPVIATLIAALLIAGFNRAFSTHLTQPRMGGLNAQQNADAADERAMPRPAAVRPSWTAYTVDEPEPVREWQKGGAREAAKDPAGTRTAETTPAAPPAPVVTRRPETRQVDSRPAESRPIETRRIDSHVLAPAPVMAAPLVTGAPPVAAALPVVVVAPAPPPVVMAAPVAPPVVVAAPARQDMVAEPPMVTVPDRQRPQPQPQYAEQSPPPPQPQGPIGTIANTLNPATWFARAREFGEKIEAVGNEILPTIRQ